jgi:hypothetical protein
MPATDVKGDAMVRITLDWRDGRHYARGRQRPCRICDGPTNLRDTAGAAACKRCVEGEIEAQVLAFARTLIAESSTATTQKRVHADEL